MTLVPLSRCAQNEGFNSSGVYQHCFAPSSIASPNLNFAPKKLLFSNKRTENPIRFRINFLQKPFLYHVYSASRWTNAPSVSIMVHPKQIPRCGLRPIYSR